MQLEEITPQLIESVQQMHEKIRSVAISSVSFGDNLLIILEELPQRVSIRA